MWRSKTLKITKKNSCHTVIISYHSLGNAVTCRWNYFTKILQLWFGPNIQFHDMTLPLYELGINSQKSHLTWKKRFFLWKLISNWLWNFHWACRQLRAVRRGYFSYRTFNTSDWLTKTDTQKPHSRSKCLVCTKNSEKPYASFLNEGDTLEINRLDNPTVKHRNERTKVNIWIVLKTAF